jgi:hypothetical protein
VCQRVPPEIPQQTLQHGHLLIGPTTVSTARQPKNVTTPLKMSPTAASSWAAPPVKLRSNLSCASCRHNSSSAAISNAAPMSQQCVRRHVLKTRHFQVYRHHCQPVHFAQITKQLQNGAAAVPVKRMWTSNAGIWGVKMTV